MTPHETAELVEKAILAARLYHGSLRAPFRAPFRAQQKLYDRKRRAAAAVGKRTGVENAEDQIEAEARRLGPITPTPGKDY